MDEFITVHRRVSERHPEVAPRDVAHAWGNRIATADRHGSHADEVVAVGFDAKGRMIEMVAVIQADGMVLVFHAMTPPSAKTLAETHLIDQEVLMEYKLKDGAVVNDDMLEEMAAEWESGEWEGHLENVVVGVPKPTGADDLTVETFRIPKSRVAAVEAVTSRRGMSKSEFYRRAVDRELAALA